MSRLFMILAAFLPAVVSAQLRDEQFAVGTMLSTPFPSEIMAANQGSGLALNESGARKVWYATGQAVHSAANRLADAKNGAV